MKKIVCMILALSVFVPALFAVNVSAYGDYVQIYLESGYLSFVEYDTYCTLYHCDTETKGDIIVPQTVEFDGKSLPVKKIDDEAFSDCYEITAVTIPDGVTEIGNWVFFNCVELARVNIPASVVSIGDQAFLGCYKLERIDVDEKNTEFASYDGVLFRSDMTELIKCPSAKGPSYSIPDGVSFIGSSAFEECTNLRSVTIPESVTQIYDSAFYLCNSMESVYIPKNVEFIGSSAFAGCHALQGIQVDEENLCFTSYEGVLFDKYMTQIVAYPNLKSDMYKIPSGVTSIYGGAFSRCIDLKSVTIPDTVESIDNRAFSGCISLTSVKIPDSVTYLGGSAFSYCDSLANVILPDGITEINEETFALCTSLSSITIPAGITSVEESAFFACDFIEKVYFKGSEEQWKNISFEWGNDVLESAELRCDSSGALPGDINADGEVNNKDVVVLFRYVSGTEKAEDESVYDFNGDGEVDNKDVVSLFRTVSAAV